MFNNSYYTPSIEDSEDAYFLGQESWQEFVKSETENLSSRAPPAPGVSEIMCEKPQEYPERMEEDYVPYDQELYYENFINKFDTPQMQRNESYKLTFEFEENVYRNERSECTRDTEVEQEDAASVSTKDSAIGDLGTLDSDAISMNTPEENWLEDDFDVELKNKIVNALMDRPDEEKAYIEKIFPMLLASVKDVMMKHQAPLDDFIVATLVKELLYSKESMLAAEREVLNQIIQEEMDDVRYERPEEMVTESELAATNRKEKKATKGNRNGSSMNHLNENYVSNIFQFAKRNYPEDKELQKISNARNVSASNFRKLTGSRLTDGVMTRKAKARIVENGKEFIGNIEHWMKDGYFEQCSEREKYIFHKQKALRDLALSGKY